jgi:hypothetical protein
MCQHVQILTCSKGFASQKIYMDDIVRYGLFTSSGKPRNHQEALSDPRWKSAMDLEYEVLMKNQTWHLVPPKRGASIIDCKWV